MEKHESHNMPRYILDFIEKQPMDALYFCCEFVVTTHNKAERIKKEIARKPHEIR